MASPGLKPLQVNVVEEKKNEIKSNAAKHGMTLKDYVLSAVDYYEKNVLSK